MFQSITLEITDLDCLPNRRTTLEALNKDQLSSEYPNPIIEMPRVAARLNIVIEIFSFI